MTFCLQVGNFLLMRCNLLKYSLIEIIYGLTKARKFYFPSLGFIDWRSNETCLLVLDGLRPAVATNIEQNQTV